MRFLISELALAIHRCLHPWTHQYPRPWLVWVITRLFPPPPPPPDWRAEWERTHPGVPMGRVSDSPSRDALGGEPDPNLEKVMRALAGGLK